MIQKIDRFITDLWLAADSTETTQIKFRLREVRDRIMRNYTIDQVRLADETLYDVRMFLWS